MGLRMCSAESTAPGDTQGGGQGRLPGGLQGEAAMEEGWGKGPGQLV